MSIDSTRRILWVLKLIADMPAGEGWVKPTEIVTWSGISHSTVYRYLPKLQKLGYLHMEQYSCRKLTCKRYRITQNGLGWFDGLKEIF